MTLERIRFEKGIPFEDLDEGIKGGRSEILTEGYYDLNPPWWQHPEHSHSLMVLKDGTGIYRRTPRGERAGIIMISRTRGDKTKSGGMQCHIPGDYRTVLVGGDLPDGKQGIYAVVFYSGEQSSKK